MVDVGNRDDDEVTYMEGTGNYQAVYAAIYRGLRQRLAPEERGSMPGLIQFQQDAGSVVGGLFYAAVLCPPLIEIDGMVFHDLDLFTPERAQGHSEDRTGTIQRWLEVLKGDREAVESVVNHVHPWRVLGGDVTQRDDEAEVAFAEALGNAWRSWLRFCYPDRQFVVEVDGTTEEDQDPDAQAGVEVTFYQPR